MGRVPSNKKSWCSSRNNCLFQDNPSRWAGRDELIQVIWCRWACTGFGGEVNRWLSLRVTAGYVSGYYLLIFYIHCERRHLPYSKQTLQIFTCLVAGNWSVSRFNLFHLHNLYVFLPRQSLSKHDTSSKPIMLQHSYYVVCFQLLSQVHTNQLVLQFLRNICPIILSRHRVMWCCFSLTKLHRCASYSLSLSTVHLHHQKMESVLSCQRSGPAVYTYFKHLNPGRIHATVHSQRVPW